MIARLKAIAGAAIPGKVLVPLESVHVLDLAPDGCIKPHVDSVKVIWSFTYVYSTPCMYTFVFIYGYIPYSR